MLLTVEFLWWTQKKRLIFEENLEQEQYNYENNKRNPHPFYAFVIFTVQPPVFSVWEYYDQAETYDKKYGKNDLPCGKHILIFTQS